MTKYNARRVVTEEGAFDSQREHKRWGDLKLMERAGKVKDLKRQVKFELIPRIGKFRPIFFVADFTYRTISGDLVVEDSKGYRNRLYLLKRRLMLWRHGIDIFET